MLMEAFGLAIKSGGFLASLDHIQEWENLCVAHSVPWEYCTVDASTLIEGNELAVLWSIYRAQKKKKKKVQYMNT